jgi:hypothetical protein
MEFDDPSNWFQSERIFRHTKDLDVRSVAAEVGRIIRRPCSNGHPPITIELIELIDLVRSDHSPSVF